MPEDELNPEKVYAAYDLCADRRAEIWSDIRELLDFELNDEHEEGSLSEDVAKLLKNVRRTIRQKKREKPEIKVEKELASYADIILAEQIALRAAFLLKECPTNEMFGEQPSMILGALAGQSMKMEMMATEIFDVRRLIQDLFSRQASTN